MPNKMPISGLSSANHSEKSHSGPSSPRRVVDRTGSLTSYFVSIVTSPWWTADTSRLFPFEGSVSVPDPKGDFSVSVAGLTKLMRPAPFAQRENAIDYRREFARIDDLRDLCELRAVRLRAEDRSPDAEVFGFLLRRRLDQRNEISSLFQN